MRRYLVLPLILLAAPAAVHAQAPVLTLKAPTLTYYGHKVDFVGRLAPKRPNARIRLYRGQNLVTYRALHGDGTFRIPVAVFQPGYYQVRWGGFVASKPVVVRVRPRLTVSLGRA